MTWKKNPFVKGRKRKSKKTGKAVDAGLAAKKKETDKPSRGTKKSASEQQAIGSGEIRRSTRLSQSSRAKEEDGMKAEKEKEREVKRDQLKELKKDSVESDEDEAPPPKRGNMIRIDGISSGRIRKEEMEGRGQQIKNDDFKEIKEEPIDEEEEGMGQPERRTLPRLIVDEGEKENLVISKRGGSGRREQREMSDDEEPGPSKRGNANNIRKGIRSVVEELKEVKEEEIDEDEMMEMRPMKKKSIIEAKLRKVKKEVNNETNSQPVIDGKVKGESLNAVDRRKLEDESCIMYAFPRRDHGNRKIQKGAFDLFLEGEVEGGVEEIDTDRDYTIDAILANAYDEGILVQWVDFEYPSWAHITTINKRGVAMRAFNRRDSMLDCIMKRMMAEGQNALALMEMRTKYPNFTLKRTGPFNDDIKCPGIVYLSGLYKREKQINRFRDALLGCFSDDHSILFVDWTTFESSSIPIFEYLLDSTFSENAEEVMMNVKANTKGCNCTGVCDKRRACCANKSERGYKLDRKVPVCDKPRASTVGGDSEGARYLVDVYECDDSCACDSDCQQRVVQKGVLTTLVVFFHPEKGWTLRTVKDIKQGEFVCDIVGEVLTKEEAAARVDKSFQCSFKVQQEDGGYRTLVIDSSEKGNVSRFVSHSCDPNLVPLRIHFEINGRPKRHIGLFANRNIQKGEELSYDYYPMVINPTKFHAKALFNCKCEAEKCREKEYKAIMRQRWTE